MAFYQTTVKEIPGNFVKFCGKKRKVAISTHNVPDENGHFTYDVNDTRWSGGTKYNYYKFKIGCHTNVGLPEGPVNVGHDDIIAQTGYFCGKESTPRFIMTEQTYQKLFIK